MSTGGFDFWRAFMLRQDRQSRRLQGKSTSLRRPLGVRAVPRNFAPLFPARLVSLFPEPKSKYYPVGFFLSGSITDFKASYSRKVKLPACAPIFAVSRAATSSRAADFRGADRIRFADR